MTRRVKEPTLILDRAVCEQHIGFRSPWRVRLRLCLMALAGRVRGFRVDWWPGLVARGWVTHDGVYYVVRVDRVRLKDMNWDAPAGGTDA